MHFAQPWALVFIPVFAVLVAIPLLRQRRLLSSRALLSALLRLCVLSLATLALAGPYTTSSKPAEAVTALVDISASITNEQGDELLSKARALAAELSSPLSVVPFGKSVAPAAAPLSSYQSYAQLRESWQKLDTGRTDIAQAISASPPGQAAFALLLSDGYETVGSVRESLTQTRPQAIFPLTSTGEESDTALSISQLHAPLTALAQKSVDIRIAITNSNKAARGAAPQSATIELKHGETVLLSKAIAVPAGQDLSLTTESDPSREGLNSIQAKLAWSDSDGAHVVTKTIWLSGEKRNKVLLLSGSPEDDRFLSRILTSQAYQLRSFVTPVDSSSIGSLSDYRVVVLNNTHLSRLPQSVVSNLRTYIKNGGGLVVIGGNTSFGLGGYIGSPLEELLPLRLVPPHQEKKRLTIAVQLVIDKSRSMATDSRLEFAKSAAEEVVRNLKDDDYIGVIGFDEVPFIALPLSRLSSVRDSALSRISRLFPTSKTNLFPALDEARRGLASIPAGRKHIIVLTDGKLPDPGPYYFDLIRQMRFLGITLSTVLVGADADDGFLAQLAQSGGGAFYQTSDPQNLPRVFLSDIKVASGERTLVEEPELAVRSGPDPIVSTDLRSFPAVRGFVETLEREAAETELVVRNSEGAYPLLASWQVGKGRSIAFTSDANGRWSSNWMRWERVQDFWSEVLESAQSKETGKRNSNMEFDLRSWVEGSDAVIDLALFEEIPLSSLTAQVQTPLGERKRVELHAVTRGHYQARISNATSGTYRATVSIGDAELPPVAWELSGELFGERQHRKPDLATLSQIARQTGGVVDPSATQLLSLMRQEAERREYSHKLLVAALLLLFVEVLLRLIPPARRVSRSLA